MENRRIYWKRVGRVLVEDRNGTMRSFTSESAQLDFKFSGEKVGDVYGKFTVGILGLTLDTINELTVWNPVEAMDAKRRVVVYAGYEHIALENPIFDGYVLEAMPTNPPEMWINMTCIPNFDLLSPIENPNVAIDAEVSAIFRRVCEITGKKEGKWECTDVDPNKRITFTFDGQKNKIVKKFSDAIGICIYDDMGILRPINKRGWRDDPRNVKTLSTETGMLGLGNITMKGATIRRRLDDSSDLFSWINLQSKIVPKANGMYYIVRKKHVGHLRGNEWYTELDTIRKTK